MKTEIDFYFRNEGTIIMMMAKTEPAKEFVENYLQIDSWQSKNNIAIECRYFDDIFDFIIKNNFNFKFI